jgi:predicted ATP-grasp superfamily ATP-dependent carboligase
MSERILVTDVEERAALAVCRGLAAAGYAVSAVAGRRPAAGHWSRSVSRRYTLPSPRTAPDGFAAGLARVAAAGEHAALVPSVDAATLAVSQHRGELEPHLRIGLAPHAVVLRCLDKPAVLAEAEAAGIGPPPSATCADVDEAAAAAARLGYPVVVKPTRSLVGDRMETTRYADRLDELRALLDGSSWPVIVQRCEPGAVVSVSGVCHGGELLAICVARDERMWPPRGGFTSASTTIEPPPGLVDRVASLLERLGWQGIFQVELVETPEGPATIDFNPRPYGSLALALAAGANLAAIWVHALLGRPVAPVVARAGVRYRWEETEILNAAVAAAAGRLGSAGRILRPRRHTTHAFFRLSDPAPLAARALGVARSRLVRR